jgi:hypothetical protein
MAKPGDVWVNPMELRKGDRLTDGTGDWVVIGHPFTSAAGTIVHVRVLKVGDPPLTELREWGAQEKVSVKRSA